MVKAIGNDIIAIKRIAAAINRSGQHFLDKVFTDAEQAYCNRYKKRERHYAGRFAAKESVAKALGCGIGAELSWLDIEIVNDARGKPVVNPSPSLQSLLGDLTLHISISHCTDYATAVALLTR